MSSGNQIANEISIETEFSALLSSCRVKFLEIALVIGIVRVIGRYSHLHLERARKCIDDSWLGPTNYGILLP